jgi:transcriptional regulator with XRE-family HTH domain
MASRTGSSVRRRMLGRQLRLLREAAGLTLDAAAPALDWSVSKLSRIEIAQQAVDVHGVRSMLDLYNAGGEQWTELTTLAREASRRGWWRAYGIGDNSYVGFETEATQVQTFTLAYAPGLLQVAEYSQALFHASPVRRTATDVEREVAVRAIRQQRLTSADDELRLVAIIAEAVLHTPIGGPAVLSAQLDHLLMAAELDTVSLQVLPTAVGAHAALASGFTVLSFGDLGEPDMAYVEHALGAVHLEKETDVARARLKFDQLRSLALAPAESQELIRRAAGER